MSTETVPVPAFRSSTIVPLLRSNLPRNSDMPMWSASKAGNVWPGSIAYVIDCAEATGKAAQADTRGSRRFQIEMAFKRLDMRVSMESATMPALGRHAGFERRGALRPLRHRRRRGFACGARAVEGLGAVAAPAPAVDRRGRACRHGQRREQRPC